MTTPATPDPALQRFREYVAAGIALIVVVGSLILIGVSFFFINQNETFSRVKDLLLIVNPFLGVVIGYYFNKASGDARAEQAEATVQSASSAAQAASAAREQAEVKAEEAQAQADQVKAAFAEVAHAAEQMLQPAPTTGATPAPAPAGGGDEDASFSVGGSGRPTSPPTQPGITETLARLQLQAALARAKKVMAETR